MNTQEAQAREALARYEENEARSITEAYEELAVPADFLWALGYIGEKYDVGTDTIFAGETVVDTDSDHRPERIEELKVGEQVFFVREPGNPQNSRNISVRNSRGESLGNLARERCTVAAPLIDSGYMTVISAKVAEVVPSSQSGKGPVLKLETRARFENLIQCTLCKLSGNQVDTWVQELTVSRCTMPLIHVKAFFELHNRYNREYENMDRGNNDTSYAGLDHLEEEICVAREKMQSQRVPGLNYDAGETAAFDGFGDYVCSCIVTEPDRYGMLKVYEISQFARLDEILEQYSIAEEKYYWVNHTRVSEEEYSEFQNYSHWYEVLELFDGKYLPVDLQDESVVSIFGCGSFKAFADLSYGC